MIRVPTHREPTHPGEMLLREFLEPLRLSQQDLARRIGVPYQRVNELVNQRRGVTPSTALRLAQFFGNSPAFWLNLQLRWDLYHAQTEEADALRKIRPMGAGGRSDSESSRPTNHSPQRTVRCTARP
ncbi:MAG: HigA family addiction module antidote protein [Acidobacteriia bacterium]|nr:HigA family addiction module antidote protein [Terriglobia bacterium]